MKKLKIKKLSEEKRYTVNGINIDVRINYRKERITLIDEKRNKKQWLFAEREVEYLDSWVKILGAMQEAIKLAKVDLGEYLEAIEKEKEDKHQSMLSMLKENTKKL